MRFIQISAVRAVDLQMQDSAPNIELNQQPYSRARPVSWPHNIAERQSLNEWRTDEWGQVSSLQRQWAGSLGDPVRQFPLLPSTHFELRVDR
jgi:hypothetical protein